VCSGQGRCECGRCVCDAISKSDPELRYSGDFCQCNNYNCDYHGGLICGGASQTRAKLRSIGDRGQTDRVTVLVKREKTFKKRKYSFRGHLITPVFNTKLPKVSTGKSPTSNIFAQKCGRSVHIHRKLCNLELCEINVYTLD